MNASHRRPLAAYVLVTVAGSVVVAQGLFTGAVLGPDTLLGRILGGYPVFEKADTAARFQALPEPEVVAPVPPLGEPNAFSSPLDFLGSIDVSPIPQAEPEAVPVAAAEPPTSQQPDTEGVSSSITDDGAPAGPVDPDPGPDPGEDPVVPVPGPGGLPVLTPGDDEPTEPVPTEPVEPLPNPVDPPPTEEPPVEEPIDDPGIPPVVPEEPAEEPEEPPVEPEQPEEPVVTPEEPEEPVVTPEEPEEPVVTPEEPEEPADPECEAPQQEQPVVDPPVADEPDQGQDDEPAPAGPTGDQPAVLGRRG